MLALCLFAHGSLLCAQQRQTHHLLPNMIGLALNQGPGQHSGEDRGNAPINDEPCGAVPQDLMIGSTVNWTGTYEGATDSEGYDLNSVWESFTLSECATVTINRCGTTPIQPNGLNFLRGGSCDALTTFHGTSFSTPDCGDGNLVHTYYGLPAGTYFIYLGDMAMGEGTYSLEATAVACAPPPVNDEACAVTPSVLAPGTSVTFQGTLVSATDAEGFGPSSVWEAFTLTECSNIKVDWCGSEYPYFSESAFLIVGDCAALADGEITYMYQGASCGEEENLLSAAYSLPPGTYYLFIPDDYGASPYYNAVVTASECIPPPVNDFCADVTPLPLAIGDTLTFEGMTTSATNTGDFAPDWPLFNVPTTWHAFTTTICSTVKVSYCSTDPPNYQFWSFLALDCPADSIRQGSWTRDECGNMSATIYYYGLPAGTYNLPVSRGYEPTDTPYTLEVTATTCDSICAAWAENGIPVYEKIGNVQFAGIDNSSTAGIGYEDFTAIAGEVVAGETYPMTVTISNGNGYEFDQVLVWLDADQSNSFTGNELLYTSPIGTGPFSADIIIPADALAGTSRLRLRMHDTDPTHGPSTEPCGGTQYGQVEDYSLNVTVGTGIQPLDGSSLALFPNPNDGRFTVSLSVGGSARFELLDLSGRLVHSTQQQVVAGVPVQMDLGGTLAIGSYVLHTFVRDHHNVQHVVIR